MAMDWIRLIPLILGSAAVLTGTAISWHVNRTTSAFNSEADRSATQYQNINFIFAVLAAWLFWLSGTRDLAGKSIWSFLFYGLFFYAHVLSNISWQVLDDFRYAQQHSTGSVIFYNEAGDAIADYTYSNDIKRLLGAGIVIYVGLYLLLAVVHGKFEFRCSCSSNFATFLFIAAIACNIIGIIILWNLSVLTHQTNPLVNPFQEDARHQVFAEIAVPQTVILLLLAGTVWHERTDGADFAAGLIGIWGLWYLLAGFQIKSDIQGYNNDSAQISRAWAGTIFCWASTFISLLTARFAVAHHRGSGGDESKAAIA